MEQQQFKVPFSVGAKLLVSIVALLLVIIVFLNLSTIFLLSRDKQAYTYQTESTEAVLTGKQFVTVSRHGLDFLRLALGGLDPLKPLTEPQISALNVMVHNQTEIEVLSLGRLDIKSGAFTSSLPSPIALPKNSANNSGDDKNFDLNLPPETIQTALPELLESSFALVNISKAGSPPGLGLLVADLKLKDSIGGMPVALGAIDLKELVKDLTGDIDISVATRSGWLLFDTNPTELFSRRNISQDPLFKTASQLFKTELRTGVSEFQWQGERYLGSYSYFQSLNLVVLAKSKWKTAMRSTYALTEKFILLGCMAIGIAVIFAILFSKSLTAPIKRLYEGTREIARGNFDLQLETKSKDEIGALSDSFNVMSKQIGALIKEVVNSAHLEAELEIASTVQQTLIPGSRFQNDRVTIRSHYQAASQCGGDWWGYFGVENRLCIMIADATGHGLPSALITASARSCFSVLNKIAQEDPDFSFSPSAMLSYANRVIYEASLGKIMMTAFIAVLDFDLMTLTFASAGHNPPWLFKKKENGYILTSLVATGSRLGEVLEGLVVEEKTVDLDPNDVFFLYTDGLTEGKDPEGKMYGKKQARKMLVENMSGGPEQVIDSLMADFLKHNHDKVLDDDVTLVALKILEPTGVSA